MSIVSKLAQILSYPCSTDRIKAELRFVTRVNEVSDGNFDALLENVFDRLIEKLKTVGFINSDIIEQTENELSEMIPACKEYTLHIVTHAHIDMNWVWGYQETVNLTLDTFRTMIRLMEEYPEFTFSQSQASTYKICEDHDPFLFEKIKERIAEGRWEVTASTWTEADKNLPSGESFARHNLYTKKYMKEKFGLKSEQLQLDFEPDTFGHSLFTPEIVNNGEVKYYYHCRGKELEYAYRYKSPSGAEILCYQDPFFYGGTVNDYLYEFLPEFYKLRGVKSGIRVIGVGDHGGGPTRRDIEWIRELQKWPLSPQIVWSSYADFFKELETYKDKLPVIDSERNFIFTGCYSSQSEIKAGNRLCEDRLYSAETLSAFANTFANGRAYNAHFENAWHKVLFNQFHDILPGSCVRDSRHHAVGLYQETLALAGTGLSNALTSLAETLDTSEFINDGDLFTTSEGAGVGFGSSLADFAVHTTGEYGKGITRIYHVFNTTSFERDNIVRISVWDWSGDKNRLTCETTDGKKLVFAVGDNSGYWGHTFFELAVKVKVPAFGVTTVIMKEAELESIPLVNDYVGHYARDYDNGGSGRVEYVRPLVLENELIRAEFDSAMCLVSLIDKKSGDEMVREKAGYFEYYSESSRNHMPNAWSEGTPVYKENINLNSKVYIADRSFVTDVEQKITYDIEYKDTRIHATVSLANGSSILEYKVNTDWRENGFHGEDIPTLRFRVPLSYSSDKYLYDIPMGTIERPSLHHDVPARGFIYAPKKDSNGVAVMCNVQGAYRAENDTISTTLIRATSAPDHLPEFGNHYQAVAIGVLPNDKMELFKASHSFIHPLFPVSVCPHKGDIPCNTQWLNIEGEVIVSGIKTAEDSDGEDIIIRVYSVSDKAQKVSVKFLKAPVCAVMTNTLEKQVATAVTDGNSVSFELEPFSIGALKVTF